MQTIEIEEELTGGTEADVLPGAFMTEPPSDPDTPELPESFPIDVEPDPSTGGDSLPQSFPIDVEPDPSTGGDSLPQSFPIPDVEPDDSKS